MEVRWRAGSRFTKVKAEDAYAELEDIKQESGGVITPAAVVERAKDDTNVLHEAFEWDDATAANKHRLSEARNLIRSVQVIRTDTPIAQAMEVYHHVTRTTSKEGEEPKKVYMRIDDILADPVAKAELLKNAIVDALTFKKKYYLLSELSQITGAIDMTLEDMDLEIETN